MVGRWDAIFLAWAVADAGAPLPALGGWAAGRLRGAWGVCWRAMVAAGAGAGGLAGWLGGRQGCRVRKESEWASGRPLPREAQVAGHSSGRQAREAGASATHT